MSLDLDSPHRRNLAKTNQILVTLRRVNRTILHVRRDRARLLRQASAIIFEELDYPTVWIGGADRIQLAPGFACGDLPGQAEAAEDVPPWLAEHVLAAVREGVSIHVGHLTIACADGGSCPYTLAVFPAIVSEPEWLVLAVAAPGEHDYTDEETDLLKELVGDLAFAVDRMAAEERTHQAEQALLISEDRFRRLAEHSLVGIVLIQNDLYRYVNPAFAEMFGYESPQEIIDRLGPVDLAAPESRDIVRENVQKRVTGQIRASRYQYRGLSKDGRSFDVEEHGARTVHAQRLAVVATVIDVTAREASRRRIEALATAGVALSSAQTPQEALDMSVEQVARIFAADAASVVLLDTSRPHLAAQIRTVPPWTSAVETIVQRAVEDDIPWAPHPMMLGESIVTNTDALPESHRPLSDGLKPNTVHSLATAPLMVRGEMFGLLNAEAAKPDRFTHEDGRHLRLFADHVAATLQHLRLIASLENERNRLDTVNRLSHALTETLDLREVAGRALREIGAAAHAEAGLLFLCDRSTGDLVAIAAEGYDETELPKINKDLRRCGERIDRRISDLAASAPPVVNVAGSHWDSVGAIYRTWAMALEVPLRSHGELLGLLVLFTCEPGGFETQELDLVDALSVPVALAIQNARFYERAASQAKAMEDALHRQEELDRMKTELIQNVSHELRTPLALVLGYAEMLNSGQLGPVPDEQSAAIEVITRRSRMLRRLVEDIALMWHVEQSEEERELLDLDELVTTTVTEFQAQAASVDLALTCTTMGKETPIEAVPMQIRRVLDNLIGNALKFTSAGGSVNVQLMAEDGWVRIETSDDGIGVPQEKLDYIFERFYQVNGSARRTHGGTGLGLALAKAIVEAHGGEIYAESPVTQDPDRPGTRVIVLLPLAKH